MGLMDGKKCLIMGVANNRSIAWGIARALHAHGARIALSYQNERFRDNARDLVGGLPDAAEIPLLPCDVAAEGDIEQMFAALAERWGRLDVLVHSLAYARQEDLVGNFLDITRDGYRLAHEISAWSLIACAKAARPLMVAAGGGSIITLSYIAAERVVVQYNVMATAKAALECSVRYLAAELGPENIRCNAISAGPLRTLAASGTRRLSTLRSIYEKRSAMKANISIEEVGDVGLFLASEMSRSITGATLYADRGFSIMGAEYEQQH
jgi:enoyl-[acyl-carrier protein] reductase I